MTLLDESDDIERGLLESLRRVAPAADLDRDQTLGGMGLDELDRARFLHDVERAFVRPVPDELLRASTTLAAIVDHLQSKSYWAYPRPPWTNAADMARADFAALAVRPALHAAWRPVLRALWRFRVEGQENLPRDGPFVLVANHQSHADTPCLLSGVPLRRLNATHPLAAMDYFFERPWKGGAVHVLFNALPLDRHAKAESAMKAALDLLADGRGVVLFPEGTRSVDGEMAPFKRGVGLLLASKPYPAVPAKIVGTREVMPKGRSWPRLAPIRIKFGAPASYEEIPDTRDGWAEVARDLEARVRAL